MFTRLVSLLQMRRSTAFLLERRDDRLLSDIGLTRTDLEQMHLGIDRSADQAALLRLHSLPLRAALPAGA